MASMWGLRREKNGGTMNYKCVWVNDCGSWSMIPDLSKPPIEPDLSAPGLVNFDDYAYWEREQIAEEQRFAWGQFKSDAEIEWDMYRKELAEYRKVYMKSDQWFQVRKQAFQRDKYKCVKCGAKAEQAHHKTYSRIGRKGELDDLISVCNPCHKNIHKKRDHDGKR